MSATSPVAIANMALSHIGARSKIESFDESSIEAEQTSLWYDHCRLQTLEASDWNFARKRVTLALHSEAAPEGVWAYRYQYPSDCIAARRIPNPLGPSADQVPFEIEINNTGEVKTILTNLENAELVYTKDVESPTLFSTYFVDAISHLLASYIAYSLTGTRNIKADELNIYSAMLRMAAANNANEQAEAPPKDAPWITGR